jgi:glucans biosynthesis protein C
MATAQTRLPYIDNLRSTMIVWVVLFHTAITYSHIGSWYYSEPVAAGPGASVAFLTFEVHSQAFFMGLLFFVSGYFVPGAYDRKGPARFLSDRLVRLGIPSLLYIFAIQPLLLHYLLGVGKGGFGQYYGRFLASRDWLSGSGPMWFAIALLIFCALYAAIRWVRKTARDAPRLPGPAAIVATGLGIAAAAFLIRTVLPMGSSFLYFQPPFFAQYVVLFAAGIAARRGDWLERFSATTGYAMLAAAILFSACAWPALLIFGGGLEKGIVPYCGGWTWQNAGYAVWESVFCVLFSTGLLVLFRERFDTSGRIWRLLKDNAFGIYVLHPPVVVAVSQIFGGLALPPFAKWLVVAPAACAATLAVVLGVRRIPLLGKVLQ